MSSGVYSKLMGYHNRRSIRLRQYDYSQPGYYFVTICVHDHNHLFGDIIMTDSGPVLDGTGSVGAVTAGTVSVGAGSKPAQYAPRVQSDQSQSIKTNLNEIATVVHSTWNDLSEHIPGIKLDAFVIMPNHVHGIIRIVGDGDLGHRAGLEPAPTKTVAIETATKTVTTALTEIVRQFKTFSAKHINTIRNSPGKPVWQRDYYDQIIHDAKSLLFAQNYIRENPLKWLEYPGNHIDDEIKEFKNHGRGE